MSLLARKPLASKAVFVDIGPETGTDGAQRIQRFIREAREWDSIEDYVAGVAAYDPFRKREHIERTMKYNIMQRADGKLVSKHFPRLPSDGARSRPGFERPGIEDVAKIECPVLIARGSQSDILSPEAAERFAAALPKGILVTVPDCGHNVHSQNSPGFLAAVRPFLAQK
jgi:pimeloyl-ACP methyl ester carboxylesterase